MLVPLSASEMYYDLLSNRCELDLAFIGEVSLENYRLSPEENFAQLGIQYDEILRYLDIEDDSRSVGYGESVDIKAWTTNFIISGELKSAVFIISNPEYSGCKLSGENEDEFLTMLKFMSLVHELGHVHDFQNSINFDHDERHVKLCDAEAYADVFAIKYFKSLKHPYGDFALKLYSRAMLERLSSSEFYKQVHSRIKKKVLESKLRKWAR
ncbi:hypothetical protein CAG70_17690 [Photobacterium halotolerans]|uniref:hypothetical protein n=1 Tax=Photobacterium halotolerans TaxID=265726 RepID=UPI001372F6D5|nr:hypothetical protein [Photobacterium halotolerans]NAX48820.1 hypothetical protein [Photobacterium halotolerans]